MLADYQKQFKASLGDSGVTEQAPALCILPKLTTCDTGPGWCYETNFEGCAQKIVFAPGSPPSDGSVSLACTAVISN